MTMPEAHGGQHGNPELGEQLRACLGSVIAARGRQPETPAWRNIHTERLQRYLAAAHFEDSFHALLTFAQRHRPELTAGQLTVEFLERIDEGKILRQASVEYAHAHRIQPRRARRMLLLAVNLQHYGQDILRQLQQGLISVPAAELAASKLTSIPEPHPKQRSDGDPWSQADYEDARRRVEQTKRRLGRGLAELAEASSSEGEFKAKAAELRNQHHPEPDHIRHAKAVRRRYLRSRPADDGMAYLDALLPAADVVRILRTVKAVATRHRADGLADKRTDQQLDVNIRAAFRCAQEAFALMAQQQPAGGRIINNGSISAQIPRPHSVGYAVSKHAMTGLTKAIELDGRPVGISCTQIDIGNAATELLVDTGSTTGALQADGRKVVEPMFDVAHAAKLIAAIADTDASVTINQLTVTAQGMPYAGRG